MENMFTHDEFLMDEDTDELDALMADAEEDELETEADEEDEEVDPKADEEDEEE